MTTDQDAGLTPYLELPELAALLGYGRIESIHNAIYKGTCPVPTYKLGRRRVADRAVVQAYFARKREQGLAELAASESW